MTNGKPVINASMIYTAIAHILLSVLKNAKNHQMQSMRMYIFYQNVQNSLITLLMMILTKIQTMKATLANVLIRLL
ncbi:transmembrane protein, putative (macronuclear) [Tetrahymena thermophila SB210]|uniref:Transmembrane protein, putative n=1 Tax=Tetrahymena thermophila (strain SB210) TaxID=312017 RepID=W7X127_TETTS|nr:transmembrane protein, putative [Tetrahymena thermophila SB210]EWS72870.1 transmembrane protein, putative [Tetrahymena thermophila SB210]|eukprot:XP_012654598.1 transmembrane protein, putative [Tetrahymena thermophila SB210]